MQFLGTLFGDHAKTGIGTAADDRDPSSAPARTCSAATMPPKVVAPFSWGEAGALETYRVDKFLEVAERMMARRQVALGDAMRRAARRARTSARWSVEP